MEDRTITGMTGLTDPNIYTTVDPAGLTEEKTDGRDQD